MGGACNRPHFGIQSRNSGFCGDIFMSQNGVARAPDAQLLLAAGCPHCPIVLEALSQLVKEGRIGGLQVTNVGVHPERAQALGVRSVPWTQIGPFVFEGLHTKAELQQWAERAGTAEGVAAYFEHLLAGGGLNRAIEMIRGDGAHLRALLMLLENPDTDITVRIGIGAIMEAMQGTDTLKGIVDELGRLSQSEDARVRADACYYLSLTGGEAARPFIEALLEDADKDVQEIAREAMEGVDGQAARPSRTT